MRIPLNCLPRVVFTAFGLVVVTVILAPLVILAGILFKGGPAYVLMRTWGWAVSKFMGLTFSIHGTERLFPELRTSSRPIIRATQISLPW